jgi:thiosulfate/3-mercaptopyruvate sulfurtransferase
VDRLIEPAQLADTLEAAPSVLVHAGDAARYAAGHIPGAVLVTPAELVSGVPPATGRLPELPRLETLFAALGYDPALTFIAYDDEGGGWAGRFLWTLDVIGHDRWRYLDGGLHAWVADGRPLERTPNRREPTTVSLHIQRAPIAERDDVVAAIDDGRTCVWDCRSHEEYVGAKSGSRRAGHIPGAVHLDWLDLMDPERGLRLRTDLPTHLAAHGIDREAPLITHCQTHHRSGLSYLVARLLDFPAPRAYHGSWSEWGNRDDTPVRTGADP